MFNSERQATVILVATTIIAALGWLFSKETIQGLPPFGFIGARFTIASLCLMPLCYRPLLAAHLKDLLSAAGVGLLLGSAVMTWIYAISVSETLGEGAFIMSLSMLFVPIVAWVMFHQRPQRIFWISLPIAVIGLACLSLAGGWKQSASQFWFLGAAFILALHFNVNSKYSKTLPVLLLTCVQLFSAGCLGLLVSLLMESVPAQVEVSIWWWFALSTLLATSLRYVMQTMGQKFVQAGNAALIMILEPVWTVILSVLWYGEVLTANKLVGCALILCSLIIYRTGGRFRLRGK